MQLQDLNIAATYGLAAFESLVNFRAGGEWKDAPFPADIAFGVHQAERFAEALANGKPMPEEARNQLRQLVHGKLKEKLGALPEIPRILTKPAVEVPIESLVGWRGRIRGIIDAWGLDSCEGLDLLPAEITDCLPEDRKEV